MIPAVTRTETKLKLLQIARTILERPEKETIERLIGVAFALGSDTGPPYASANVVPVAWKCGHPACWNQCRRECCKKEMRRLREDLAADARGEMFGTADAEIDDTYEDEDG